MALSRRIAFGGLSAALIFPVFFQSSAAQTAWPTQPLKIIVPFAPGGSSDFIARLIAKPLGDALKVTVVVENRAGNAGNVGAAFTAQATDQHTVMLSDVGSIAISALVVKDLAYKITDLKGVAMLGYSPHLLAVNPNVPANTLKELVELSKKKRINVASAGSGSPNHLGVVEIASATGMEWQHVPYKGGAQAMADTIAGNTDIVLNGMLATMPHVQGGKLKAIAVSKRSRVAGLPNVPTVAEQGVAGFESGTYQGITVAASMPKEHVAKLNAELLRVMNSPDIKKRTEDAGAEVTTSTPEQITEFLNKEKTRWESVISRAGANLEGTK
jgi:tripartite-type tricarboxylate transporter receptor subunit TctC